MTRVISYNILTGGTHRLEPLTRLLRSRQPDIVGLIEAIDEQVVAELAQQLGMAYRLSGRAKDKEGQQAALLTRFPILSTKTYTTAIVTKQPLLEVCLEEPDGNLLTVFVAHQTAEFRRVWRSYGKRRREMREFLRLMAPQRDRPHLLMGDFNSVAPGDHVRGSAFLRYMTDPRLYYHLIANVSKGLPNLNYVLPRLTRFLKPLLRFIPKSSLLCAILDRLDVFYAPRGGIDLLLKAGYVDCFRALHPHEPGCTWPSALPAGRIDFIFASPDLAQRLRVSEVIGEGEGMSGDEASDHLAISAVF